MYSESETEEFRINLYCIRLKQAYTKLSPDKKGIVLYYIYNNTMLFDSEKKQQYQQVITEDNICDFVRHITKDIYPKSFTLFEVLSIADMEQDMMWDVRFIDKVLEHARDKKSSLMSKLSNFGGYKKKRKSRKHSKKRKSRKY
jgi:hypothetical protein